MSNTGGTPSDEERVASATEEARGYVREGLATELGGELAGLRAEVAGLISAVAALDESIDELGGTWGRALDARVAELRRERRRAITLVVSCAAVFALVSGAIAIAVISAWRDDRLAEELCPLDARLDRLERIADDLITDGTVPADDLITELCE